MSDDAHLLRGIALAVSAYRSDEAVIGLLRSAFLEGQPRFGAVIVVDSLGSGAIERAIRAEDWDVHYINSDHNLGSAGNLALRLKTAAELDLQWCLAVNHDGVVDPSQVATLARHGSSRERVGAVYPQLIFTAAGGRADSARRRFTTFGVLRADGEGSLPPGGCESVVWSSSNGALYNLDPIRGGMHLWPELWMGYEDLAVGWELMRGGWTQLLCSDVRAADNYEFTEVRLLGRTVHLAVKPSWYNFYELRNLALIARRSRGSAVSWANIGLRMMIDLVLILMFRDRKLLRLRLLMSGLFDGLRNVAGKGPVP